MLFGIMPRTSLLMAQGNFPFKLPDFLGFQPVGRGIRSAGRGFSGWARLAYGRSMAGAPPCDDGSWIMSAFRQSVETMIPALRRYARALTRDADIADDLVQDTLVRALRSEKLFHGGDLRSWLTRSRPI